MSKRTFFCFCSVHHRLDVVLSTANDNFKCKKKKKMCKAKKNKNARNRLTSCGVFIQFVVVVGCFECFQSANDLFKAKVVKIRSSAPLITMLDIYNSVHVSSADFL